MGSIQVGWYVDSVLHLEVDVDTEVIPQALPNPGQFIDHGNAEFLKVGPSGRRRTA